MFWESTDAKTAIIHNRILTLLYFIHEFLIVLIKLHFSDLIDWSLLKLLRRSRTVLGRLFVFIFLAIGVSDFLQ